MRPTIILFIALLAGSVSFAQNSQRTWDQGPLTWNDFHVMPASSSMTKSHIFYIMAYNPAQEYINKVSYNYYRAEAYILPENTWVDALSRDEATLRFNQVIFDMVELGRRNLQRSINSTCSPQNLNMRLQNEAAILEKRIQQFKEATKDGTDTAFLSMYEQQVQEELKNNTVNTFPVYEPTDLSAGMFYGIGSVLNAGSLNSLFPYDGFQFNIGFSIGYKRHNLLLTGGVGPKKAHKNISAGNHLFRKDTTYNACNVLVEYGYCLLKEQKQFLMPTVGLSVRGYEAPGKVNYPSVMCPGPTIGIMYARHFWQKYDFPRCRLFAAGSPERVSDHYSISFYAKLNLSFTSYPKINTTPFALGIMLQTGFLFGGNSEIVR